MTAGSQLRPGVRIRRNTAGVTVGSPRDQSGPEDIAEARLTRSDDHTWGDSYCASYSVFPPESCMGEEAKAGRMRFARHWLVRPRVVAPRSTKRGYGRVALQLCPCASAAVHLHGPRHRGIRNAAPAGWRARWIWGSGLGSDGASAPRYSENCETQAQERQHRRFGDTDATASTGAASRTGTFDVHIIQADIVKAG